MNTRSACPRGTSPERIMVGELKTMGLGLDTPGHKVTLSMARSEEIELRETMDVCI